MKKISTEQKLTMLKHLVNGTDVHEVAVIMHLDYNDVVHCVAAHGYPDLDKMKRAAEIVERNLDRERNTLPGSEHGRRDQKVRRVETVPAAAVAPVPATRPPVAPVLSWSEEPETTVTGKADVLLRRAAQAGPRFSRKVDKIWDLLGELEKMLDHHLAHERAQAEARQAREAARQRVEKAKEELAAAQAALRAQSHTVAPKVVREWAKAQGLEVAARGLISDEVREAYARAHQSEAS